MVVFYYFIGDLCCRIDHEWFANLYQKTMSRSVNYDEKINFWFWKEPSLNKETDL